jgi:hypothetical protein
MISCAKCERPIPSDINGAWDFCPNCRRPFAGQEFPAAFAELAKIVKAPDASIELGEATCFFHEAKKAAAVCDGCGRYLCSGCQADWLGKTLCLSCIHTQREVKGTGEFQSRITLYDNIALALLFLPFITTIYGLAIVLFTAPIALYLVLWHRKKPRGIVPRGPLRSIFAGGLATLFILGWVAGIVYYFFIR